MHYAVVVCFFVNTSSSMPYHHHHHRHHATSTFSTLYSETTERPNRLIISFSAKIVEKGNCAVYQSGHITRFNRQYCNTRVCCAALHICGWMAMVIVCNVCMVALGMHNKRRSIWQNRHVPGAIIKPSSNIAHSSMCDLLCYAVFVQSAGSQQQRRRRRHQAASSIDTTTTFIFIHRIQSYNTYNTCRMSNACHRFHS